MIAETLIVGMTFQIAVNPPGGVWEGDIKSSSTHREGRDLGFESQLK